MDSKAKGDLEKAAVNKIAFDTYLKYWCYPGPKDERGDQKEICDLLILFKETAIIISVKNYSFTGNYERYFRSTLNKALSQLSGAERKLFNNNREVYFAHPDLGEKQFDKSKYTHVQRIIINLNTVPLFYPGGLLTPKNEFAHIFNWEAFLGVVGELNTIPDFIEYLREREILFTGKNMIILKGEQTDWDEETGEAFFNYSNERLAESNPFVLVSGSELDLLANYYTNQRKFTSHLYENDYNGTFIELDGTWENYLKKEEVIRKKEEDRASYFVDEFIKREVLYKSDESNLELATELLSLSRFERRAVGISFFEFLDRYRSKKGDFVSRRYGTFNDLVIAFVYISGNMQNDLILGFIELAVEGFCYYDNYKSKKIACIAYDNKDQFRFGYLKDIAPFEKEYEEKLVSDLQAIGWFQNIETVKFSHQEYPKQH
jgi:hypothetical protein